MTSMTVTSTIGLSSGHALCIKVMTGAAASQPGATAVRNGASGLTLSITPNASGSIVYGGYYITTGGTGFPSTPATGTTFISDTTNNPTFGREYILLRSTNTTTAASPVSLGIVDPGRAGSFVNIALAEILANGTLAEDSSAPAMVGDANGNATSRTTASFDPPAGSLLIALVMHGAPSTVTMSDSQSLTWTKLAGTTSGSQHEADVWAAQIPGAPPPPPVTTHKFGGTVTPAHPYGGSAIPAHKYSGALVPAHNYGGNVS